MRTESMHSAANARSGIVTAHAPPPMSSMQRRGYTGAGADDGASVEGESVVMPAMKQPRRPPNNTVSSSSANNDVETSSQREAGVQRPNATTAAPSAPSSSSSPSPAQLSAEEQKLTQVKGNGCTYILRDEIGRGAYGRVYLTDVVLQSDSSSTQLTNLRSSLTGIPGSSYTISTANNNNTNGSAASSRGAGHMVLKRMENASVEDGLQAATLRELMVLDEVSTGSAHRERLELEAFSAGRAPFKLGSITAVSTAPRSYENSSAFSFLDSSAYNGTTNTNHNHAIVNMNGGGQEERFEEDGVLTSSAAPLRSDEYEGVSPGLRWCLHHGRRHLLGMRDTIMRPQEHLAYVAMDYCEGGDLWHFLRDLKLTLRKSGLCFGDVMPVSVFRRWAVELISALAFLHAHNISHRDLKPQNLMLARRTDLPSEARTIPAAVTGAVSGSKQGAADSDEEDPSEGVATTEGKPPPDGDQFTLKVGDFGLSRLEEIPYKKYVHEAVTLWYRSPDVLLGNTNYIFSADAWSLGCILVEMASGSVLFKGRDEADELRHIFTRGCRPSLLNFQRMLEYPYHEKFADVILKYRDTDGEAAAAHDGTDPDTLLRIHVEKLSRHLRAFLKERNAHTLLGSAGIDLVARLLIFDPEKRFTVLQAVNHPFFSEAHAECSGGA